MFSLRIVISVTQKTVFRVNFAIISEWGVDVQFVMAIVLGLSLNSAIKAIFFCDAPLHGLSLDRDKPFFTERSGDVSAIVLGDRWPATGVLGRGAEKARKRVKHDYFWLVFDSFSILFDPASERPREPLFRFSSDFSRERPF